MWAGVQKVSRPIVMCQEMSHSRPTMMLVDPASMAVRYQGRGALAARGSATGVRTTDSMTVLLARERTLQRLYDARHDSALPRAHPPGDGPRRPRPAPRDRGRLFFRSPSGRGARAGRP